MDEGHAEAATPARPVDHDPRAADASIRQRAPLHPAYYWAGAGSAIVHRLKGFNRGIDQDAYRQAYTPERLRWLRDAAGVDFLFLSFNWGLPPEIEAEDWQAFAAATRDAHALGMRVAAYVQPSNAVALGSYAARDWYAVTPKGKRIPYYAGRFFTCLNHPDWRATVHARAAAALDAGADAIFVDNCAFGGMPIPLSRDYTAFAGCYCPRCQDAFRRWQQVRGATPHPIPRLFRPGRDPVAREFAHWRAWTLTDFLRDLRDAVHRRNPRAVLLTNTVGAVNFNTYQLFGVDLPELAHVVDWLFVENLLSPRAEPGRLVQNAGTFKLLHSLKPGAPALSISYDRGIGVDGVPSPRTFARMMAEAYAAGGVPVLRACEYIRDRNWTLVQPGRHDRQMAGARWIAGFVRRHPELFQSRQPAAPVAVHVPPGLGWRGDFYPEDGGNFLGVIQALVSAAIPFRVLTTLRDLAGVRALILPPSITPPAEYGGLILSFADLGIRRRPRSVFDYLGRPLEPLVRRLGPRLVDGYYSRVHVRRFIDRLDLLHRLFFNGQFRSLIPAPAAVVTLRAVQPCVVLADGPIYADVWRTPGRLQLHLVNYGGRPVAVRVASPLGRPVRALAPEGDDIAITNGRLIVDTYAIVEWDSSE